MTDKENLGEGTYCGKKLKEMSRQELYEALYNHDQILRKTVEEHHRDLELLTP